MADRLVMERVAPDPASYMSSSEENQSESVFLMNAFFA